MAGLTAPVAVARLGAVAGAGDGVRSGVRPTRRERAPSTRFPDCWVFMPAEVRAAPLNGASRGTLPQAWAAYTSLQRDDPRTAQLQHGSVSMVSRYLWS